MDPAVLIRKNDRQGNEYLLLLKYRFSQKNEFMFN